VDNRTAEIVKSKFSEYLLPTMMNAAAVSMASVVDGIIVGNLLGSSALAAVGLCSPFIFGNNAIFSLFTVGGITCASIARGERNEERSNRFFTACLLVGVAVMLLYSMAVTIFAKPLCAALAGGDAALASEACNYLSSLIWTGPFLIFSMCSAQFWKVEGNPKSSTRISLIANGVNLICDYVLIRYLHMGIRGAGLSTVLGYMIGVLFTLGYYRWPNRSFLFQRPGRWLFPCIKDIVGKGAFRFVTSTASLVQNLIINTLIIRTFGPDGLAVLTVCINAMMIAIIFIGGTSETLHPILSTLFGEKDIYGIREAFRRAFVIMLALCVSLASAYIAFPEMVGRIFGITGNLSILDMALRLYAVYIPFYAVSQLLQTLYNSTGHSKNSVYLSVVEGFVLINGYALLLFAINSSLLWLCYALGSATILLLAAGYAAWTRRKEPGLHGILLLPEQQTFVQWQSSFSADNEHASALSQGIIDFCKQMQLPGRLTNHMAVAAEEMAVNTALVNRDGKPVKIDAMVGVSDDEVLLRIRNNGVLFNPLAYNEDNSLIHESIDLMVKLSTSVNYSHQLGFNTVTLSFARPGADA